MGNVVSSFASGFGQVVGKIFGSPLDFLAGKSCSSVCRSTWDFICYMENFCIANLLKMAMVIVLLYIVLLFFYLLHKLGICGCICRTICKMIWTCFVSCFYILEYCCTFFWVKLSSVKRVRRRRRKREIEVFATSREEENDGSFSYYGPSQMEESISLSRRRRDYKSAHIRKSLRPRSHHVRAEISRHMINSSRRNSSKHADHASRLHDLRVNRTSKFARKGSRYKASVHHMPNRSH